MIDESFVLVKGRLKFTQFMQTKRNHFGIKLFVLCDYGTGIVLDLFTYTETNTDIDKINIHKSTGSIIKTLLARYIDKGHILHTDSYYTSPVLSAFLHSKGVGSSGTMRKNCKQLSAQFRTCKTRQGDYYLQKSGKVMMVQWHDKREVIMLSTIHTGQMMDTGRTQHRTEDAVLKPGLVLNYNDNM